MENTPYSLRLTDENRAWLAQRAAEDDRSINYIINKLVEAARLAEKRGKR